MAKQFVLYYTVTVSRSRMFEPYIAGYDESTIPPTPIWQDDVVVPTTMLDGDASTYSALGLEPGTAYYFLVAACNRAGCYSTIIGPLFTEKEYVSLFDANWRFDPITGLTKIWWSQDTIPDRTDLLFVPTAGDIDQWTVTELRKTQTIQSLAPGEYIVTITNYAGQRACGRQEITINIPYSAAFDAYDDFYASDYITISDTTAQIDVREVFDFYDSVVFTADAGVLDLNVEEPFVIYDAINSQNSVVDIAVDSAFSMLDGIDSTYSGFVYVDYEDVARLVDAAAAGAGATAYVMHDDSILLLDDIGSAAASVTAIAETAFTIYDSALTKQGAPQEYIDETVLADITSSPGNIRYSVDDVIKVHEVFEDKGVQIQQIDEAVTTVDVVTTAEIDKDSLVGTIYDFSHIR